MSKPLALLTSLCAFAYLAHTAHAVHAADATRVTHALKASGGASASRPPAWAHMAHTLKASDTAHLRYLSASGSLLLEEGQTSGDNANS